MTRFGPYTLERTIAVGGVGEVFEATASDGPCAIKRLHDALARSPQARALFEEEGRLAQRFHHPNLVRGLDAGAVDGVPYIALELVRGPNLAEARARAQPDAARAIRVIRDLCAGLDAVHASGWVHCDVSPTNVLIHPDGRAQLTDFGVANRLGERQSEVRGTFAYMAPEQARGEPVDARTDVFALGVVLWELVTGRRLFQRSARYLTLAAVVEEPAERAGCAPALEAVLGRMLAKPPDARLASCAELGDALARLRSRSV